MYRNLLSRFHAEVLNATELLAIYTRNRTHRKPSLAILDGSFPNPLSAFRFAEINAYLNEFSDAEVHSTYEAFSLLGDSRTFQEVWLDFAHNYPGNSARVLKFHPRRALDAKLFYTIFLGNAANYVEIANRQRRPLAFTLYPGGGFKLDQADSDRKLRQVLSSPQFRRVIVTQQITREYLLSRGLCPPSMIEFIYGVVVPSIWTEPSMESKNYYLQDKPTLDICFVANKYMPGGIDKGYNVFIQVAKQLTTHSDDFRFHVVGGFDVNDGDVSGITHIRFYGVRPTESLHRLFRSIDIIVSPNQSFVLSPGAFDGFPTGSCVEAGVNGVALFCTDDLGQNIGIENGKEIIIIDHNPDSIVERIVQFQSDIDALYHLARLGQAKLRDLFGYSAQIAPRIRLLSNILNEVDSET